MKNQKLNALLILSIPMAYAVGKLIIGFALLIYLLNRIKWNK